MINETLNAKVAFGTVSLSVFRDFPNVSMRLNDLSVNGIGVFEGFLWSRANTSTSASIFAAS
ncbi:MAG: hypothetical protein IPI11_00730 [Haliscomenobacter sp.]|nr:hypothetical protein [Haliscomenobacter sp.]